MDTGSDPTPDTRRSRARRSGNQLGLLTVMLVFTAILLPERITDGGWRAWVAVPIAVCLVIAFLYEMRDVVRRRRQRDGQP